MHQEFKYKLDFYYQQAIMYLVTLILYAVVRGTIIVDRLYVVFYDPIIYIIVFFVIVAFITLVLNIIRNRKLIVTKTEIIFQNRFHKRIISIADLEWMHIGKERGVQTAGRFQVIIIKVKQRKRSYRIRLGRYEKEKELVALMHTIAEKVPKRKKRFSI